MPAPTLSFLAVLPPWHSRRTRLWLLSVLGVVVALSVPGLDVTWHAHANDLLGISSQTALLVFFAALGCEFMDSSLGMGYGTTLTPLLLMAGFEPLQIVPAILLSELVTGLAAGALHQHDGNVDFLRDRRARNTTLQLALLSSAGAVAAVALAISISRFWLGLCITGIILSMGVVILLTRKRQIPYHAGGIVAVGALAAFNKGLSGGGYGPLVTAGQVVSGLPSKHAVAVTSVAESLTCLVGLLAYLAAGQGIAWGLALPLVLGALLSVPMATVTVSRARESVLRGLVGWVTLLLGGVAAVKLLF
ncbi:MAG TPA: sulfite exporter TauE/SafE family protein [Thiobacillaceae bacterium]|nr:sulfite exporter TauE/SafE family protein [Thiobacillaceae bacterium]HNU63258.1 sulfite exporter TauE/SafE family protein [Thiobacillaceae bacterium]